MKYCKKPIVIEAFQFTKERRSNNADWPEWLNIAWQKERTEPGAVYPTVPGTGDGTISIQTVHGEHLVSFDDWIIQGINGELYSCKPDVFEKTYEEVTYRDSTLPLPERVAIFLRNREIIRERVLKTLSQ